MVYIEYKFIGILKVEYCPDPNSTHASLVLFLFLLITFCLSGVTIVCKENGIERKCTYEDIRQSFGPLCGTYIDFYCILVRTYTRMRICCNVAVIQNNRELGVTESIEGTGGWK